MNVVANSFSSSSPKSEETDVDHKRPIEDTSFLDSSNNREIKRPAPNFDSDTISSIDNTLEQSLLTAMEWMMSNLSAQFQSSQNTIISRIDTFDTRLSEIEEPHNNLLLITLTIE